MDNNLVKLTFVGDMMCDQDQIAAHKINEETYNFDEIFSDIKSYFIASDYVVGNLETPVAGKECGYTYKKWQFNSPDAFAEAIKKAGVHLVSTANNHCLDRGTEGVRNTIKTLDRYGIEHIGTYDKIENKKCFIREISGIKIAFLAYTYGTNAFENGIYLKKNEKFMVNLFQEQELNNKISRFFYHRPSKFYSRLYWKVGSKLFPDSFNKPVYERKENDKRCKRELLREIEECKKSGAKYIILCMHAGGQYNKEPTEYTKELCDFCVKHGVNIVIGCHEHVIHGCDISQIKNNIVKTYSLGNFTSYAGTIKEPFDKMAEYSIIFNVYLSLNSIHKCTFSIAKTITISEKKIKTVLLYDLIQTCDSDDEKQKLIADNITVVNTFLNKQLKNVEVMKEYDIGALLINS